MKKVLMLVTMLFSQVFFTGSVQCAEIKPIESGKGNLFPAGNDSGWVILAVTDKKI